MLELVGEWCGDQEATSLSLLHALSSTQAASGRKGLYYYQIDVAAHDNSAAKSHSERIGRTWRVHEAIHQPSEV